MFVVGMDVDMHAYFTAAAMIIAVLNSIKIFCWVATIYRKGGSVWLCAPVFWTTFTIGRLAGIVLSNSVLDVALQDKRYVLGYVYAQPGGGGCFQTLNSVFCYWFGVITG